MFQTYDIVMLVVLLGTMLFGAWKGMAWQLASLASLLLSAAAAIHFSGQVPPYFSATAPWNRILAMLIIYVLTSLAIWLVFRMVSGIIDRVKLREFDRQLGAIFGLAKGVLLCLVITFFAVTLSESVRQMVLNSHSGKAMARLTRHANPLLPEEIRAVVGKYIDELDHKLDPNTPPATPQEKNLREDSLKTAAYQLGKKLNSTANTIENSTQQIKEQGGR
ncbi:MAG: CvpA family protein [Thermoguttaceae bacterium]